MLKALRDGPRELPELRHVVGSPPQSSMRVYTRKLAEAGVLERRRRKEFPTTAEYSITPAGSALLGVAADLEDWLQTAPDRPLLIGSAAAKSGTKALIEGWSSTIVWALSARPLSLTELDILITKISYPSLERRLGAMRLARLVEAQPGDGRGTPYHPTEWLRRAVVPLLSAIAWEQQFVLEPNAQISRIDVEAALLLAVPLMVPGGDVTGRCRLSVEIRGGAIPVLAGVIICIEEGKVTSCSSRLEKEVQASISGSPGAWMRQMKGVSEGQLEISGDLALAGAIADALRAIPTAIPRN